MTEPPAIPPEDAPTDQRPVDPIRRAMPVTRYVADQVRHLRLEAGWSAAQVAERMNADTGWTRGTVAKLESGRREQVGIDDLLALARALDVPVTRLLPPDAASTASPISRLDGVVRALRDLRKDLGS